jgi:hypothetical protein
MSEPTQKSLVEEQLKDLKDAGLPVSKGIRTFKDNQRKTSKFNERVLTFWLPQWARQAAMNFKDISGAPSMGWLRASAKGLPVVVCGIGPSLDGDLETLRKAQSNLIIVATDAAVRPLLAAGVKPHLAVNFDCKQKQHTLFDGLNSLTWDIPLLANSCAHPDMLSAWLGPKLYFNMQHFGVDFMDAVLPNIYPEFQPMSNHGTVGNSAILVAYQMGARHIILSGMDLCYQKVGDGFKYRCRDHAWREADEQAGLPAGWVEKENKVLYDNDDRLAHTFEVKVKERAFLVDDPLDQYRKMALGIIGSLGNVDVVDCAPDGILKASGVRGMTIGDAVTEFAARPIEPGEATILHLPRLLPRAKDAKGA